MQPSNRPEPQPLSAELCWGGARFSTRVRQLNHLSRRQLIPLLHAARRRSGTVVVYEACTPDRMLKDELITEILREEGYA